MKTQINFKVPVKLARKFREEAAKLNKTLDTVGTIILQDFFEAWTVKDRAAFFAKAPNKKTGRKIAA